METELKQSLLLTHGTVYGDIADTLSWVDFEGKSSSLDRFADQAEWRSLLFTPVLPVGGLAGTMTDNAPIDVVHWTASGHMGETGLEWWQQCMTLFMRHI